MPSARHLFALPTSAVAKGSEKVEMEGDVGEEGGSDDGGQQPANIFERAQRAAFLAGEDRGVERSKSRAPGDGSAGRKEMGKNEKTEKTKSDKTKAPDPNQRSISAFFGTGRAAEETNKKEDSLPATCEEWDKTWEEGIEGLDIKKKPKNEDRGSDKGDGGVEKAGSRFEKQTESHEVEDSEGAESRGKCKVCRNEVTNQELRVKHEGRYFHAKCAAQGGISANNGPKPGREAVERPLGGGAEEAGGDGSCAVQICNIDDDDEEWVTVDTVRVPNLNQFQKEVSGKDDRELASELQWKEYDGGEVGRGKTGSKSGRGRGGPKQGAFASSKGEGTTYSSFDPASVHIHNDKTLRRVDEGAGGDGDGSSAARGGASSSWSGGASVHLHKDKTWRRADTSAGGDGEGSSTASAGGAGSSSRAGGASGVGAGWKAASVHKDKVWRREDAYDKAASMDGDADRNAHSKSPVQNEDLPGKLPEGYSDSWNTNYIRLPCSPKNVTRDGSSKWLKIRRTLCPAGGFHDVSALISAISSYMPAKQKKRNKTFPALESLVNNWFDTKERARFYGTTLPFIIKSALDLPSRCPEAIAMLHAGTPTAVNLSSLQIVSLLANAFLCTFPGGTDTTRFPRVNFDVLFDAPEKSWHKRCDPVAQNTQKLLCILNYFERQQQRSDAQLSRSLVTFHRRCLASGRDWASSNMRIANIKCQVDIDGRIEDADPSGASTWEADFANSMIGGGVLASGCVQEEIRFLLSPELIASLLLTERMGPLENVLITGSERFSSYTGYASDFKFGGNFQDVASNDIVGSPDSNAQTLHKAEFRRKTTITAMDAVSYSRQEYGLQFRTQAIRRDLDKAFVSFQQRSSAGDGGDGSGVMGGATAPWIATGNWGCGAFGGDLVLKAVIQIVAAAEAGRDIKYLTFGNDELSKQITELYGALFDGDDGEGCTVAQVWLALENFRLSKERLSAPRGGEELFDFLINYKWSRRRADYASSAASDVPSSDHEAAVQDDSGAYVAERWMQQGDDGAGDEAESLDNVAGRKRGRARLLANEVSPEMPEEVLDSEDEKETAKKQREL